MGDKHHFKIFKNLDSQWNKAESKPKCQFFSFGKRWRGWFLWTLFWRERRGSWSQWVASHLNDSGLKSLSENYKIASALFGDYTKRKWHNLDFLSFFFLSSDRVCNYAPNTTTLYLGSFAQSWNSHNLWRCTKRKFSFFSFFLKLSNISQKIYDGPIKLAPCKNKNWTFERHLTIN